MISYRLTTDQITGDPPPPMRSERQAAHYLGITVDEVRHQINLGNLRFIGPRARKRFLQRELDAFKQTGEIFKPRQKSKKR